MSDSFEVEFEFAGWRADPSRNLLRQAGREVRLEPRAMDVLVCLLDHAGRVVSKDAMIRQVWQGRAVTDDALVVAIYELRKALGDRARQPSFIETIPRRGYRWLPEVVAVRKDPVRVATPPEPPMTAARRHDRSPIAWIDSTTPRAAALVMSGLLVTVLAATLAATLPGSDRLSTAASAPPPESFTRTSTPTEIEPAIRALHTKARHWLETRTPASLRQAETHLRQIVELQPKDAAAQADLALTYTLMADLRLGDRFKLYHAARTAATRALRLDPALPRAHLALGTTRLLFDWDLAGAEESLRRAIELAPEDPMSHQIYGWLLSATDRHRAAEARLRRAIELDPVVSRHYTDLAFLLQVAGKPQQAIREARLALELEPSSVSAYASLWQSYRALGDDHASVQAHQALLHHNGVEASVRLRLLDAFESAGFTGYLGSLLNHSPPGQGLMTRAYFHVLQGEPDHALAALERAFERRDWEILWLDQFEELTALHGEPRFEHLVRQVRPS
ncbi:MAG: winged helix-turn-helix domain-containing protein [Acidobacteriota bacterium]